MAELTKKRVNFQGREVDPALIDLYSQRLKTPNLVLDLGCGRGSFGTGNAHVKVVGIDIDQCALEMARTREEVLLGDFESGTLPFQSETFGGFIAKDILEHIDSPERVVQELRRVLKPGGRGVVSVPMAKPRVLWGDYTHLRDFTRDAVEMMVRDSGFRVVSTTPMGSVPGAGRLGLVGSLPRLLRLPGLRRFAASHEVVVQKPMESDV